MKSPTPVTDVIMIVDDTPANLSTLFDLLGNADYKVLVAEDGESAIEQAEIIPPDLILLDILMPGMNGFATCQALKANQKTQDIPIIFMSSLTETEKKVNGFQLGAVDYITKPFQNEEVLVRVQTHLQFQRLQKQIRESEKRLSQILEGSKDAIITVDSEAKILLFNQAAELTFLCSSEHILGQSFRSYLAEPLCQLFDEYIKSTEASHASIWIPEGHHAVRSNDQLFPVEATLSCVQSSGQTLYTFILRDIDARQKATAENLQLRNINQYLQQEVQAGPEIKELVGSSQGLNEVMTNIHQVAATDATILVSGETGTGKEVVVQAIHQLSLRSDQPLIKLNCGAIPKSLVESELFGHEKGAFTGALARKHGRFELADKGTLFLDEIGDMPMDVQTKLLRILQEGQFERVGGTSTINVDVRIIAATHRDLSQGVKEGSFREDLFYRLNVFPIQIPPLRERKQDIDELAHHFLSIYTSKFNKPVNNIPVNVLSALKAYHWPGNIRELQHLIERAVILTNGDELAFGDWFQPVGENSGLGLTSTLEEIEYQHIVKVLQHTHWRISGENGAAEQLGLNASTLRSRMNKLGIKKSS